MKYKNTMIILMLMMSTQVFADGGTSSVGGGGDSCVLEFKALAKQLLRILPTNYDVMKRLSDTQLDALQRKLTTAQIFTSRDEMLVDPVTGNLVEAVNDGNSKITLGQKFCNKKTDIKKMSLVLHEGLSLIGVEKSQDYSISELLLVGGMDPEQEITCYSDAYKVTLSAQGMNDARTLTINDKSLGSVTCKSDDQTIHCSWGAFGSRSITLNWMNLVSIRTIKELPPLAFSFAGELDPEFLGDRVSMTCRQMNYALGSKKLAVIGKPESARALIETQLGKIKAFSLVSRTDSIVLLKEQAMNQMGLVQGKNQSSIGVSELDYLLVVSVDKTSKLLTARLQDLSGNILGSWASDPGANEDLAIGQVIQRVMQDFGMNTPLVGSFDPSRSATVLVPAVVNPEPPQANTELFNKNIAQCFEYSGGSENCYRFAKEFSFINNPNFDKCYRLYKVSRNRDDSVVACVTRAPKYSFINNSNFDRCYDLYRISRNSDDSADACMERAPKYSFINNPNFNRCYDLYRISRNSDDSADACMERAPKYSFINNPNFNRCYDLYHISRYSDDSADACMDRAPKYSFINNPAFDQCYKALRSSRSSDDSADKCIDIIR